MTHIGTPYQFDRMFAFAQHDKELQGLAPWATQVICCMQEQKRRCNAAREGEGGAAAPQFLAILSRATHSIVKPECLVCLHAETREVADPIAAHGSFEAVCLS